MKGEMNIGGDVGRRLQTAATGLVVFGVAVLSGRGAEVRALEFEKDIRPLLEEYCYRCHGEEEQKGEVDLSHYHDDKALMDERKFWLRVLEQVETEEMPTKEPLPSREERERLVEWLDDRLNNIDWSKVKDAGHVTLPRLNKAEYNNTMRDLLGVDLQPGSQLSEDAEGQSGFTTDRDNLYVTPADLEKYLEGAERALDTLVALGAEPVEKKMESEAMFMTETRETPKDLPGGGKGYVLDRGQMTLYDSVEFPHDGIYEFTVRGCAVGGPSGTRLRINDEIKGDIGFAGEECEEKTIRVSVPRGSHQVAWNIEQSAAEKLLKEVEKERVPGEGEAPLGAKEHRQLAKDAGGVVARESAALAPKFPATAEEMKDVEIAGSVSDLDAALLGVQRPYEWLRLLGTDGEPREILRFRGYVTERNAAVAKAKGGLAEVLGVGVAEVERRLSEANGARFADNAALIARTEGIRVAAGAGRGKPAAGGKGSVGIDWVAVRGPVKPEGADGARVDLFAGEGEADAKRILEGFLPKAFRRPVETGEVERFLGLFRKGKEVGLDFSGSMKHALTAVLVSPKFLFRHEFAPVGEQGGEFALDGFQLASRLSYFLWMSMPDEGLFAAAREGKLRDPEGLRAQVRRMVLVPKARAFFEEFSGQWLGISSLGKSVMPDGKEFPEFDGELAEAMRLEPVLTFEHLVRENRSVLHLLDSRETVVNGRLARHYGIKGVEGEEMRAVALDGGERGGLLGMAAILTATSGPTRTSPVGRGKWVLETLLGERIPEPPPGAGDLDADAGKRKGTTLREELEAHRSKEGCAACHKRIDPIGFGLENFDAIGRYREEENGKAIDSRGELPDGFQFEGLGELKAYLVRERKDDFLRNVVERVLAFGLGRELKTYDEAALRKIVAQLEAGGFGARTLVEEVVLSHPFTHQNNGAGEALEERD